MLFESRLQYNIHGLAMLLKHCKTALFRILKSNSIPYDSFDIIILFSMLKQQIFKNETHLYVLIHPTY